MWYDWNYPYKKYDNYPYYAYTSYEHPSSIYYPGRVYAKSRNPFLRGSLVSNPPTNADLPAPAIAHEPQHSPTPRPKSALKQRKEQTSNMFSKSRPATPDVKRNGQPQVYHFTDHPPFPPPLLQENIGPGARASTPGPTTQPPRYAFPQPRMYPYIPPGMQPIQQPVARQEPGPSSHGAAVLGNAATPFSYPHYPYPSNQGQAITNPIAVHPDDLKYKCTICGKFRSSRYQWKHRVPPGQLPRPTICKNCRAEATDSEDEDTDSYEERDYRHRAKGRKKSSRTPIARSPRPRSRARSISRASRRDLSHDYHAARPRYGSSVESTSSDEERRHRARSRKRRPQSDSGEVVRYVDVTAAPLKARRKKKVIYIEDRARSSGNEDETEIEYIRVPSRSGRRSMGGSKDNRARAAPRHFSDPQLPRPVVVERREYYDGVGRPSHSFRAESPQPARRQSRRQRATRSPPIREREFGGYDAEEEEDMYNMGYARPSRGRMRGGGRSSRSCSRNRVSVDEGSTSKPDISRDGISYALAPGARRGGSSSVIHAELEPHESITVVEELDSSENGMSDTLQHHKSGSRGLHNMPANDYDWYDKEGMRVRVREI